MRLEVERLRAELERLRAENERLRQVTEAAQGVMPFLTSNDWQWAPSLSTDHDALPAFNAMQKIPKLREALAVLDQQEAE